MSTSPDDPDAPPLRGENLAIERGDFRIDALDVAIPRGEVTALIGPNGSGKTTVLQMLARLLEPAAGTVYLDGRAISERSTREVAKRLAMLPQSASPPEGVTVRELVELGRYPHQGLIGRRGEEDEAKIAWALDAAGLSDLAHRGVEQLSGGERQRAWLAMALAQDAEILLLDEPTTYLDIRYQVETLSLVRSLNREHGITVVQVLHDLNQAAAYSDRIVLLSDGQIAAQGPPHKALDATVLEDVFGVPVTLTQHPVAGTPYVIPVDPRAPDTSQTDPISPSTP